MRFFQSSHCEAIYTLPTYKQNHPTCTFVNAKYIIFGILTVMIAEELFEKFTRFPFKIHPEGKDVVLRMRKKVWAFAEQYAYKEYKKFTTFIRDDKVNELLSALKTTFSDKSFLLTDEKNLYIRLLYAYLIQHHGQEKIGTNKDRSSKMASEKSRAIKIILMFLQEMKCHSDQNPSYFYYPSNRDYLSEINKIAEHTGDKALINKLRKSPFFDSKDLSTNHYLPGFSRKRKKRDNNLQDKEMMPEYPMNKKLKT